MLCISGFELYSLWVPLSIPYLIFYFSESLTLRFRFGTRCVYYVNIGLISLTRRCCKTEDVGGKLIARGDRKLGKKKESTVK